MGPEAESPDGAALSLGMSEDADLHEESKPLRRVTQPRTREAKSTEGFKTLQGFSIGRAALVSEKFDTSRSPRSRWPFFTGR